MENLGLIVFVQNDYLESEATPQFRDVLAVIGTTNQERWPLLLGKNAGDPASLSNLIANCVEDLVKVCPSGVERFQQCGLSQCEETALVGGEIYVVVLYAE